MFKTFEGLTLRPFKLRMIDLIYWNLKNVYCIRCAWVLKNNRFGNRTSLNNFEPDKKYLPIQRPIPCTNLISLLTDQRVYSILQIFLDFPYSLFARAATTATATTTPSLTNSNNNSANKTTEQHTHIIFTFDSSIFFFSVFIFLFSSWSWCCGCCCCCFDCSCCAHTHICVKWRFERSSEREVSAWNILRIMLS